MNCCLINDNKRRPVLAGVVRIDPPKTKVDTLHTSLNNYSFVIKQQKLTFQFVPDDMFRAGHGGSNVNIFSD